MPLNIAKNYYRSTNEMVKSVLESELNYRVSRLLFCLACALYFFFVDLEAWAKVDSFFYWPVSFFKLFGHNFNQYFSYSMLLAIKTVTVALYVCFAFQYRNRILSLTLFFFAMFTAGYLNNFQAIDSVTAVIMTLTILLLISDYALSFNNLKDKVYAWSVQCCKVFMVLVYLAAGIAQLRDVGLAWFTSDNLEVILLLGEKARGAQLTNFPILLNIAAFIILLMNLTAPLALFLRGRSALVYPLYWILLHIVVQSTVPSNLLFFIAGLVFWIPWHSLLYGFKEKSQIRPPDLATHPQLKFVTFGLITLIGTANLINIDTWPILPYSIFAQNIAEEPYQKVILFSHHGDKRKKILSRAWTHPLDRRQLSAMLKRRMVHQPAIKQKTLIHLERLICKNLRFKNRPNAEFPMTAVLFSYKQGRDVKTQKPDEKIIGGRPINCSKFRLRGDNNEALPDASPEDTPQEYHPDNLKQ